LVLFGGNADLINIVCDSALAMTCRLSKEGLGLHGYKRPARHFWAGIRGSPKLGVPEVGAPGKDSDKDPSKKRTENGTEVNRGSISKNRRPASGQRPPCDIQDGG
jgi:hypothetical protein